MKYKSLTLRFNYIIPDMTHGVRDRKCGFYGNLLKDFSHTCYVSLSLKF